MTPTDEQKARAVYVSYAVTHGAYRVTVWDAESQPLDVYTGGNSRFDSAAFVPVENGETLETMWKYAKSTVAETATAWGLPADKIYYDSDEADYLLEVYGA